jgi:hypothetical protein
VRAELLSARGKAVDEMAVEKIIEEIRGLSREEKKESFVFWNRS